MPFPNPFFPMGPPMLPTIAEIRSRRAAPGPGGVAIDERTGNVGVVKMGRRGRPSFFAAKRGQEGKVLQAASQGMKSAENGPVAEALHALTADSLVQEGVDFVDAVHYDNPPDKRGALLGIACTTGAIAAAGTGTLEYKPTQPIVVDTLFAAVNDVDGIDSDLSVTDVKLGGDSIWKSSSKTIPMHLFAPRDGRVGGLYVGEHKTTDSIFWSSEWSNGGAGALTVLGWAFNL